MRLTKTGHFAYFKIDIIQKLCEIVGLSKPIAAQEIVPRAREQQQLPALLGRRSVHGQVQIRRHLIDVGVGHQATSRNAIRPALLRQTLELLENGLERKALQESPRRHRPTANGKPHFGRQADDVLVEDGGELHCGILSLAKLQHIRVRGAVQSGKKEPLCSTRPGARRALKRRERQTTTGGMRLARTPRPRTAQGQPPWKACRRARSRSELERSWPPRALPVLVTRRAKNGLVSVKLGGINSLPSRAVAVPRPARGSGGTETDRSRAGPRGRPPLGLGLRSAPTSADTATEGDIGWRTISPRPEAPR